MQGLPVVRDDGVSGAVVAQTNAGEGATQLVIEFKDGGRLAVAPEMLVRQPDGVYRLALGAATGVPTHQPTLVEDEVVIPIIAEELTIEKQAIVRGVVRAHKRIETHEARIDAPVTREDVVVERIPINQFVGEVIPEVREEEGVLIIPLIEEMPVIQKRLFIREEVRVFKRLTTTNNPQTVTLRREVVDIERANADDSAQAAGVSEQAGQPAGAGLTSTAN